MDDAFQFRAARMPRRRVDPLAIRAGIVAALVVAMVGVFAKVAIDSERRSLQVAAAPEVRVSTIEGGAATGATTVAADPGLDDGARAAAEGALAAARAVLRAEGTLDGAGPLQLASLRADLIFVDGPSAVPEVVSVAGSAASWGAAVMSESGTCYYVRITDRRRVTYGTGAACTGQAALGAADPAWPAIVATG
jgi:hypothetical protein